jgi:hypothetical protein
MYQPRAREHLAAIKRARPTPRPAPELDEE